MGAFEETYRTTFPAARALPGAVKVPTTRPEAALPGSIGKLRASTLKRRTVSRRGPSRSRSKVRAPRLAKIAKPRATPAARKTASFGEKLGAEVQRKVVAAAISRVAPRRGVAARGRAAARTVAAKLTPGDIANVKRAATLIGKASLVGAAGAAAYALTRKSKLGGVAGDAAVSRYYAADESKKQARFSRFRAALKAERAKGAVSSARVKALAQQYGPF